MRLISTLITIVLLLAPGEALCSASALTAHAGPPRAEDDEQASLTRSVATSMNVAVSLCLESGDIVVRGWDKAEVRASSHDAAQLRLEAVAAPAPAAAGGTTAAARGAQNRERIEVLISNSEDDVVMRGECEASGDVMLDVPRGATVLLNVRSGDVDVMDVAEAHIESSSGDVDLSRVSRIAEVKSISGDISLKDSSSRVSLRSFSGDIDVMNVRPSADSDALVVKATSGSVSLDRVAHTRVEAGTMNGDVNLNGALVRGGSYDLKTHSGDVSITLPADASFKVNARVVSGSGEIITAFPVKTNPGTKPFKELSQGRLIGTVGAGAGEADIVLSSFSGTLHLKKR